MTHLLPVTLGLPFLEFLTKGAVHCVGFFTGRNAFGVAAVVGGSGRASSLPFGPRRKDAADFHLQSGHL